MKVCHTEKFIGQGRHNAFQNKQIEHHKIMMLDLHLVQEEKIQPIDHVHNK